MRVPRTLTPSATWTEAELDPSGESEVRYTCQESLCNKRKLRYLRIISGGGLVAPHLRSLRVASSRFEYSRDRHARLLGMSGEEVSVVELFDAPIRARLKLTARLDSTDVETTLPPGIPSGWQEASLPTPPPPVAGEKEPALPDDLRGTTTSLLLASFLQLDPQDVDGRGRVLARLSSLLERDANALAEAARLIREGGPGARILAELLGGVQNVEGQTALARVVGDERLEPDVRAAAIRSTILVDEPSKPLIDSLRAQLDQKDADLRHRAMVAFGAGAQHVLESQPELAETMTRDLLERGRTARSLDERIAVLRALGNTGNDAALAALLQAASDPDPSVRAAAIRALRFQTNPLASSAVREALTHDSSEEVRRAALFAAEFLPAAALVDAVVAVARTDSDHALRGEAMRVLAKMARTEPEALQALTDLASQDPDPQVRELANSLLDRATRID